MGTTQNNSRAVDLNLFYSTNNFDYFIDHDKKLSEEILAKKKENEQYSNFGRWVKFNLLKKVQQIIMPWNKESGSEENEKLSQRSIALDQLYVTKSELEAEADRKLYEKYLAKINLERGENGNEMTNAELVRLGNLFRENKEMFGKPVNNRKEIPEIHEFSELFEKKSATKNNSTPEFNNVIEAEHNF